MLYELPSMMKARPLTWPQGIGSVPARLPDGSLVQIPVLKDTNVLAIGVTGTGKTVYTAAAAESQLAAVPDTLAVFFETKRSYLARFHRNGDKVIAYDAAAVGEEHLFRWNMVREIRLARNPEAEMRKIADHQFADLLKDSGPNRVWVEAARETFIGVLRVIVFCTSDCTTNWNVVNAMRNMPVEKLLSYLARHPRNHSLLTKSFGYPVDNPASYRPPKRAGDIQFFLNSVLNGFSGAFESNGDDTIADFLHGRYGRRLFILYDLADAEISRPFILYFLKKLKDEKMSLSSDVKAPMLWVMDEADKIASGGQDGDFGLYQAATLGREYALQILLATQSIENLYALAPDFNEHIAEGGYSGFPVVVAYRPGDPSTVSTLQTLFGSQYREVSTLGMSRYAPPVVKCELQPAVTDSDFASLGLGQCYVKIQSHPPRKVTIIYDRD